MSDEEARRDFLREFLAERDAPCPMCDYNLRALTDDRCPECGSEVEVKVGLTEPRLTGFIAGIVALAMGLGFNAIVLVWASVMMLQSRGPRSREIVPLMVGSIVCGTGMWAWIRFGRTIRRMEAPKRARWVAACFIVAAAASAWFFMVIR